MVAALCALALAPSARAADPACRLDPDPPPASERLVHERLDGLDLNVLLPPGYASSDRRYPVLYLLHARQYSANSWLARSDVEELSAGGGAIVVMPDTGNPGWAVDYLDGSADFERYLLERVVPHVDGAYRTIADGAHRAVAGMSIGGHGAMLLAARHPDLFAAAGSFSGVVHVTVPERPYAGPGEVEPRSGAGSPGPPRGPVTGRPYSPPRDTCDEGDALGNRLTDAWSWHARNPADLAPNLRGLGLYVTAGSGVPCGPEDANDPILLAGAEPAALALARDFDRALADARVRHTFEPRPCGLHNMVGATRGLHSFWPLMLRSFGRPPPGRFDYRTADAEASAWGWTFRADERRAPELLEVRGASRSGLLLVGSGTETVVTGPLFRPRALVRVTGARPARARADSRGRLTVAVDLGPPNAAAQFAPGETSRPWVARRVRLSVRARRPRR